MISKAFNKVTDHLQELINNLEDTVDVRTAELEYSKDQLQLILDSTAEAIYGIDLDGNCKFCNLSCINLLGYRNQEDLLGKNMHAMIHHSHQDGAPFLMEDCKILQSGRQGKGTHVDDEVFWKADGTSFDVEYYSYPQIRNGEVTGTVITFMDITERKKREAEIRYLSWHDSLTGLHNRRSFEEALLRVDVPDLLPLSIIFADINGLKLINDIFGHAAGDALIQKSSEILTQHCREDDFIARVGGDEFIILLPRTSNEQAEEIRVRIETEFSKARVAAIRCSISLGSETKTTEEQSIKDIVSEAENAMYHRKTRHRKSTNLEIINTLVETLHTKDPREKQHAIVVRELCGDIGRALNLTDQEINKLERAAYLHDIGKIVLDDTRLRKENLAEDQEKMQQHSIVGYRILNLFDETVDISELVYSYYERWDGKGYPRGFKGEEIPLLSRIISVAQTYERVLNQKGQVDAKEKAINVIKDGSGTQFDPQIAELFVQLVE
jgi:diguanylate cyclase (GGDEF)-like protein/PAS domain S-box-containing protein